MGYSDNKEEILFQPNLLNEGSKEPQGKSANRTSSPEKWGWFWDSVEVHIKNSDSIRNGHLYKGKSNYKIEIQLYYYDSCLSYVYIS